MVSFVSWLLNRLRRWREDRRAADQSLVQQIAAVWKADETRETRRTV